MNSSLPLKVKSVEVKGLFDNTDILWHLDDVSVLVGQNAKGKTTILNCLLALLRIDTDDCLDLCKSIKVVFDNDSFIEHQKIGVNFDDVKNVFAKIMANNKSINTKTKKNQDKHVQEIFHKMENLYLQKGDALFEDLHLSKGKYSFGHITEEELKNNFNVEFVSTIYMNANSINEIRNSEGKKTTILDLEISKILRTLHSNLSDGDEFESACTAFTNQINAFLKETNKKAAFDKDELVFSSLTENKNFTISQLSSGERQLVYIFLKVMASRAKPAILLMDEPEISLHLSWQEKLIDAIKNINNNCQIIIVTHSPAIVINGWMDCYVELDSISRGV